LHVIVGVDGRVTGGAVAHFEKENVCAGPDIYVLSVSLIMKYEFIESGLNSSVPVLLARC